MALSIRTFVVRGEPKGSPALQEHIRRRFGWEVSAPKTGEVYEVV